MVWFLIYLLTLGLDIVGLKFRDNFDRSNQKFNKSAKNKNNPIIDMKDEFKNVRISGYRPTA